MLGTKFPILRFAIMESRKEHIYRVAARLFRKQGYVATSMRIIADEVGIQAPSIYNHVKSKQELLYDLLLKIATAFTAGMEQINTSSLDTQGKLERLVGLHVRLTIEYTDSVALIAGEWQHLVDTETHSYRSDYLVLRDQYEAAFRQIIEEGKAQGVIHDVDTEIILFSILSTLRWLYSWYSRNRDFNPIELERQIAICLLDGIKR